MIALSARMRRAWIARGKLKRETRSLETRRGSNGHVPFDRYVLRERFACFAWKRSRTAMLPSRLSSKRNTSIIVCRPMAFAFRERENVASL